MLDIIFFFILIPALIYLFYLFIKEGGFSRFKCDLGIHDFTKWEYINNMSCKKRMVCSNCGEPDISSATRTEHNWEMVYLRPGGCELQERCSHCSEYRGEKVMAHQWVLSFIGEKTNQKKRACSRCGEFYLLQKPPSSWDWVFTEGNKRQSFITFQISINQLRNVSDFFIVKENFRHREVKIIEDVLPDSNFMVYGFQFEDVKLIFFPNGIHIYQMTTLPTVWLYDELTLEEMKIKVSKQNMPADGTYSSKTWLHTRVDGLPDRRYSPNPVIHKYEYSSIVMKALSNLEYKIVFSSQELVWKFFQSYYSFMSNYSNNKTKYEYSKYKDTGPKTQGGNQQRTKSDNRYQGSENNSYQSRNEKSDDSYEMTATRAYEILGLRSKASPEEIRIAYREMVKQYHPDKVNGLGIELRKLAEEKMKLINAAYDLLK
jgi:hypothetical protein